VVTGGTGVNGLNKCWMLPCKKARKNCATPDNGMLQEGNEGYIKTFSKSAHIKK